MRTNAYAYLPCHIISKIWQLCQTVFLPILANFGDAVKACLGNLRKLVTFELCLKRSSSQWAKIILRHSSSFWNIEAISFHGGEMTTMWAWAIQFCNSRKTRTKVVHKNVGQGLKSDLLWPSMTSGVILNLIKYLRIHKVSIHINLSKSIHN